MLIFCWLAAPPASSSSPCMLYAAAFSKGNGGAYIAAGASMGCPESL